jgi:hypothetical protein
VTTGMPMAVPRVDPVIARANARVTGNQRLVKGAEFTANARVLEPAEWSLLVVNQTVNRYAAGEDLRGDATRALYIGPAYEGVEAEARIVGVASHRFRMIIFRVDSLGGATEI